MLKYLALLIFSLKAMVIYCQDQTHDSLSIIAQKHIPTDTIFFDKEWKVCDRSTAEYYRLIQEYNGLYQVTDYYKNGVPQMIATYSSLYPEVKEGEVVFYYPNGKVESKGMYVNNEPKGVWRYYNKKGWLESTNDYDYVPEPPLDSTDFVPFNQSSFFVANIYYRYKLNKGSINSSHGFGIEIGLNPGYFISQKLLLAPFVGINLRDQLYKTKFNSSYMDDFNNGFNGTTMSGHDSIVVNYMAKDMNTQEWHFHEHGYYYGLMLKLPFRFAPIMKVYKGFSSLTYKAGRNMLLLGDEKQSNNLGDHSYFDIDRQMNWGAELFLYNGFTRLLKATMLSTSTKKRYSCNNIFALSIYIEEFDTYHSSFSYFDGENSVAVPMTSFMSPEFMNKHKKEYNIGIRLSFGLF